MVPWILTNKAMLPVCLALFFHGIGKIVTRGKYLGLDMYLKAGADTLAKLDHAYALAVEDLPEILIPDPGSL